jgi:hypothetical protein
MYDEVQRLKILRTSSEYFLYCNDVLFLCLRRNVFTARYELNLQIQFSLTFALTIVPWLRCLVAKLLWRRPIFKSRVSPCEICGGQSDSGTRFSPIT